MKRIVFPVAAAIFLLGHSLAAQDDAARKADADTQQKTKAAQDKLRTEQERSDDVQQKAQQNLEKEATIEADAQQRAESAADKFSQLSVQQAEKAAALARKLADFDEIIISKKGDTTHEKLVLEINGDKVTINGKPIEDFVDQNISVRIRSPRHYTFVGPSSPFRSQGGRWQLENSDRIDVDHPNKAFLGVMTEKSTDGAKITSITENSAAGKAGLKIDDVITKVNNQSVADQTELAKTISALKPDDKVSIVYKREGKEHKTSAVLGKRTVVTAYRKEYNFPDNVPEPPEPPEPLEPLEPVEPSPPMAFDFDGIHNEMERAFNFNGRPRLGIKAQDTEDGKGVKVLGVDDDSPAEKAGLKENDVITSFDGKTVNSATELADASRASKDKSSLKLEVKRNGKTQDIELKVPKKLKTANL